MSENSREPCQNKGSKAHFHLHTIKNQSLSQSRVSVNELRIIWFACSTELLWSLKSTQTKFPHCFFPLCLFPVQDPAFRGYSVYVLKSKPLPDR